MPVAEVRKGEFKFSVAAPGSIEAARRLDMLCQIKGLTTIMTIVPEGSRVKKGDLVCELDSSLLRDQLTNQKIYTLSAEAAYQNAKLARELAQLSVKEYEEGTYPLDRATILGEIKLAESAVQKASAELERTRRARQWLSNTRSRKEAATGSSDILAELDVENRIASIEQSRMREQFSVEKAQGRLNLLDKYTKDRMIRDLTVKVEERMAVELAKEQVLRLERDKESSLEKQIVNSKLNAPGDGLVVYADDPPRMGGGPPQIEAGATVRERQLIFTIFDIDGPKQVNARAPEATVDRLLPGQKARIEVEAFPGETLSGEVIEVAPRPDPTRFLSSDIKVYTTKIRIDGIVRKLRPGMTARVEILVLEHENALRVPAEAVLQYDGKAHVAVKKPDGGFEWRDVTLGAYNGAEVEVKHGINPGEHVALDPAHLLTVYQRQRVLPTPPASKKDADADRAKGKARGALPPAMIEKMRNIALKTESR